MAVSSTKSVNVALMDASPKLSLEPASAGGKLRVWMDTIALVTADTSDDGDIWYFAELPSNAKIVSIKVFNDDIDSNGTPTLAANLGVYNGPTKFTSAAGTTYAANALIDEDSYATAITTFQSANTTGVELAYEARNINLINNFIWEDCGLTADPGVPLRLAFTVTTAAATHADGDVSLVVTYSQE